MAHPNLQTNGASLEDCHTNFFALTDLCGIRWRKLSSEGYTPQPGNAGVYGQQGNPHQPMRGMSGGVTQPWDYLNDPVLSSYWRCLSNDILCVWRRIPASSLFSQAGNSAFPPSFPGGFPNPSAPQGPGTLNTLAGPKELWIFWYGDTSPDLTNLVVPEILSMEGEQGSWENGLSYECRSLLFKALHNLIERCLLSRDFVRLGKWFVQPQEGIDPASTQKHEPVASSIPTKNNHLSFSFSFFVHGESTVCASIDVRQHPVVRRITQRHLAAAQAGNAGIHVLLAPYGLAGVLTGTSYKSSTDSTTRKLMEEWKQYYPVECASPNSSSQQRGPGPGGGFDPAFETEDMVEVIVGNVRMRYPSYYVLVCDADSATNSAALNQLSASEGGSMMTPPASPVQSAATLTRSLSHSGSQTMQASNQAPATGPLLPSVPCSTAAALTRLAQAAHSWRPEEAAKLSEHAWQDSLLSTSGLCKLPEAVTPEKESNIWDFQDPTVKHSCSCVKSRRNKASSQGNGGSSTSTNLFGTTSSSAPSSLTCSVSSSSSSSSVKRNNVPFHLRAPHTPAARPGKDAVPAAGLADPNTQDRANRSGTPATSNASTTTAASAPPPALPTYQRSQAALKGPSATTTTPSHQQQHSALNTSSNSVGPFLASPASVVPSPVPTPHSHAPLSVPPMDSSLTLPSPHPPASNEPNFAASTPSAGDGHHSSLDHARATPGGAVHTPGGPKSNAAYSPYVAIPSVDTPGWPHSVGPAAPRTATATTTTTMATSTTAPSASANTSNNSSADASSMKIALPTKEYEQELKEEERGPSLLYDYNSLNAWLFHPVKQVNENLMSSVRPQGGNSDQNNSTNNAGLRLNGGVKADPDAMETNEYEDDPTGVNPRKRKEPDSRDDDSINATGAKQVNPNSLFTIEGLQPSYHDLDKIFDNSDDSNDAFPVPTPPGSNKPAGLPEDTALVSSKPPRITAAHPSPGTTILGHPASILASAEKMFPTPPSHEHPMQSPCGQLEHAADLNSDIVHHNGMKTEPGYNGCSPSYLQDDNKDWSYVYLPPTTWKMPTSSKYAPLTVLPSQTMASLNLPAPYRPSSNANHHPPGPVEVVRPPVMAPSMRPFGRMPNAMGPPYFPRGPGPAPFSPISPSPFAMEGFGPHGVHGPRPGMGNFPPHNTLKQLLQHQQGHHAQPPFPPHGQPMSQQQGAGQVAHHQPVNQPQSQHLNLPECHSLVVTIVLGDSMLNVFRDHNFDSCSVCVCSDGQSWVGSIRGPDAFFYLPESKDRGTQKSLPAPQFPGMGGGMGGGFMGQQNQEEESCPRCNCGFSALVNRRLAHQAGLFYEDEVEIAGAQLTRDPVQFKLGSLYALCHSSEKEEHRLLMRSRAIDFGLPDEDRAGPVKPSEKESDKDTMSSTIAAVVMEATAPTVDNLPVALMDLLREQCLLLHHSSSPLFKAEQLQAASRKTAVLHALDLSDSCDTARLALNLALYINPPAMPLTSPMQGPPPPYQQTQQPQNWGSAPSTPSTPYGMPFSPLSGPTFPTGGPGFQGNPQMHPPVMSPSLHSPNLPVRGRPSTPGSMGLPMAMSSPVGMPLQRPTGQSNAPPSPASPLVHYWPFLHVAGPGSSHDVVKVMRHLQPLLQDSIQKKRAASLWRAPFAVQGPLTWRQFIQMAVRGTEDRCGPQPIPAIMAGYDRDWVTLAPLAVPHWDRLLLEPYSKPRDIAYIVVAPEVDYVLGRTKAFFKELSGTYEICRFGKHVPYKALRDGILRVGKTAASKLPNDQHPIDDWFTNIGDSPVAQLLRLYARVCRYHLAPTLNAMQMDRTLLDPPQPASARPSQPVPSPMAPPSTTPLHTSDYTGQSAMGPPNPTGTPLQNQGYGPSHPPSGTVPSPADSKPPVSPKTEDGSSDVPHQPSGAEADDDNGEPPSIVIYMVDPFSFGSDSLDLGRLTTLGLMRCYHQMMATVSETIQANVTLQLISADSILKLGKDFTGASHYDSLRALALNVFTQSKKLMPQTSNVKSLTGFGPTAAADTFIKAKDEKNRAPVRVYLPPYVLAPMKNPTLCDLEVGSASNNGSGVNSLSLYHRADKYSVLYVSYCLSEDQRWLIAACTDERGELVDNCTIGIDVPNRTKRKRASVRRFGLQRLMDFILGVISTGVNPWRLVIGRLGRMGHGELRGWSALLSRKNLLRVSRHLAEVCGQCSMMFTSQAPTLVSACLVSLEPDSHFRLMPDQFTIDERFGQHNCHLSTPEDASCTHILVFPTSATTRSPQTTFQEENINGPDLGDDDLLSALNDDMDEQFVDGISGFDDLFMTWPDPEQAADGTDDIMSDNTGMGGQSGGMNNMGGMGTSRSPGAALGGAPSPSGGGGRSNMGGQSPSGMAAGSGRQSPRAEQEEVGTLLQQPLALGYYVSTAPTGEMPAWFWASCPHMARSCPAFLKCALHLHNHAAQQGSDDLLLQQQQQQQSNTSSKVHPLDSQVTTDVLRYVMEGYNALSWLALDPKSRDRRSCLPIHIQLLVQLYHALSALV